MNRIILLHGAIGASDQLKNLKEELSSHYDEVLLFDFPGHGGKAFEGDTFSIRQFAESFVKYLEEKNIRNAAVFGYSMGGYVALYVAKHYPGFISRITTLATKFNWNAEIAMKEVLMLDPEMIRTKVPKFAEQLEKRHAPNDWKEVLKRTAGMMLSLGSEPELNDEDLRSINVPVTLVVGDSDKMVSREETERVAQMIPGANFILLPETQHPIEKVDLKKMVELFRNEN